MSLCFARPPSTTAWLITFQKCLECQLEFACDEISFVPIQLMWYITFVSYRFLWLITYTCWLCRYIFRITLIVFLTPFLPGTWTGGGCFFHWIKKKKCLIVIMHCLDWSLADFVSRDLTFWGKWKWFKEWHNCARIRLLLPRIRTIILLFYESYPWSILGDCSVVKDSLVTNIKVALLAESKI